MERPILAGIKLLIVPARYSIPGRVNAGEIDAATQNDLSLKTGVKHRVKRLPDFQVHIVSQQKRPCIGSLVSTGTFRIGELNNERVD